MHRIRATLSVWLQRSRSRRALAQVDPRSLRDAGIDPGLADYEAAQPFWRPSSLLRDPQPKAAAPVANDCGPALPVHARRFFVTSGQ